MSKIDFQALLNQVRRELKQFEGDDARAAKLLCLTNILEGTDAIEALGLLVTAMSLVLNGSQVKENYSYRI